jgi:hypothetical protein
MEALKRLRREHDMRLKQIVIVFACALVVGGSAMLAAPGQTQQPGQMTQAHVWVQNRGHSEAVPVDLRDVNTDTPLRVHVVNGEPGSGSASNPLQVRPIRQLWDYQTVAVPPGTDLAPILNARGASGWETTGIAFVTADGTTLLLKRPR